MLPLSFSPSLTKKPSTTWKTPKLSVSPSYQRKPWAKQKGWLLKKKKKPKSNDCMCLLDSLYPKTSPSLSFIAAALWEKSHSENPTGFSITTTNLEIMWVWPAAVCSVNAGEGEGSADPGKMQSRLFFYPWIALIIQGIDFTMHPWID